MHIAIETPRREEARQHLSDGGFSSELYGFVDPQKTWFCPGADTPEHRTASQPTKVKLRPGDAICCGRQGFLFSGSIISHGENCEQGLTVAHAVNKGEDIEIVPEPDSQNSAKSDRSRIIGKCREKFKEFGPPPTDKMKITADLALLELNVENVSVSNTVLLPYRLKMFKGKITSDVKVVILDQGGNPQFGCIHRPRWTDATVKFGDSVGIFDVLGIGRQNETSDVRITEIGDSGALVMSVPDDKTDIVYVYGNVIGICHFGYGNSLTIANKIWPVIEEIPAELIGDCKSIDYA